MQVRLDCVSIQALVDTSRDSAQRWLAADPEDRLGQSVQGAVARAEGLLPLLLPVSNRCLAARHWAAILALLPVSTLLFRWTCGHDPVLYMFLAACCTACRAQWPEGLLPLLLSVSSRCLAARPWAAFLALLPVRTLHFPLSSAL